MDSIVKYAATVLVTIVISGTGFWMMIGREYVTRTEAEAIAAAKVVGVESYFEQYRLRLEDRLAASAKQNEEIKIVINKNTEVINDFKVQMAIMTKTLSDIEKRLNEKD